MGRRVALVWAVYLTLVGGTFLAAFDALMFDMTPKQECWVFRSDGGSDTRIGTHDTVTTTDFIPPEMDVEHQDGFIAKSTAPYGDDPCDNPELDEYRTGEYTIISYASTGGPYRVVTIVLGVLFVATIVVGWRVSKMVLAGVTARLPNRDE